MEYQVFEYGQSLRVDNKERERKVVRAFQQMLNVSVKSYTNASQTLVCMRIL